MVSFDEQWLWLRSEQKKNMIHATYMNTLRSTNVTSNITTLYKKQENQVSIDFFPLAPISTTNQVSTLLMM